MHRSVKRLCVWLIVIVVCAMAAGSPTVAQESPDDKAVAVFEKGIAHYRAGEYEKARSVFDQVLSLRPSSVAALRMRQKAELGLFAKMKTNDTLDPVATKLLALINQALREKKRDVKDMDSVLTDFQSADLTTYGRAAIRLIGHGPYAVPYLLEFLGRDGAGNQMIVARTMMVIKEMHSDTSLPLIKALAVKNELLRQRIVDTLGHMGDRRALAALCALVEQKDSPEPLRAAARKAIANIAGKTKLEPGAAITEYERLLQAYLREDTTQVGFLYTAEGDIWHWNDEAEKLQEKLTYTLVPGYLYYARMGCEFALDALRFQPDSTSMRVLLLTLNARQLSLCRMYSRERTHLELGGPPAGEQVRQDAARRLKELEVRVPVLCHLCPVEALAGAIEVALAAGDAPTSLFLLKMLGNRTGLTAANAAKALQAALDFGHKDIRYAAAVQMLEHSPTGSLGSVDKVMQVLCAVLKQSTARNALLVFNDLQSLNALAWQLRAIKVASIECPSDPAAINMALNLEPSISVVFLSANVSADAFSLASGRLKADLRTKGTPICVVSDPAKPHIDTSGFEGIAARLGLEDLTSEKLAALLKELPAGAPSPLSEERQDLVLRAATALNRDFLVPGICAYPLDMLEPSLIAALGLYGEPVQKPVVEVLGKWGGGDALESLGTLVALKKASPELKVTACRAMSAVMQRTGQKLSGELLKAVRAALDHQNHAVRKAAAETLLQGGLAQEEVLQLIKQYAMPAR